MTLPTITPDRIDLAPGDELILRFRTWQDYEALLNRRHDQAGLRIRYNAVTQVIKIMSPLPGHGKNADMLADWIKTALKHQGKDWEAFTPITLKIPEQQGVEPDYCFYIQSRQAILGKERLDLTQDPPPNLVVEVDLTSTTQVQDYQLIKAKELWIYHREQLRIFHFDQQQYQEKDTSLQFAEFDVKCLIEQYIQQGWREGSSVAQRTFEQCLHQQPNRA